MKNPLSPFLDQPTFKHKTDLQQLKRDIIKTAQIAHAAYDEEKIATVLNAYSDFFSGSPISIRTTTKAEGIRKVNTRYVEFGVKHNPYQIAKDHQFLVDQDHPIDDLFDEIQSAFPVLGYGVDLGAKYGLEKIWAFFPQSPQSIQTFNSMQAIPDSLKHAMPLFQQYGFTKFSLMGIDYRNKSMNVYFRKKRGTQYTTAGIAELLTQLNFKVPSEELLQHCTQTVPVYFTFSWETLEVERICYAILAPEAEMVPQHLHPVMKEFTKQAPCAAENTRFIFNPTFGKTGNYIKIEVDYTDSILEIIKPRD